MFNFVIKVYEGLAVWQDDYEEGNYTLPEAKSAIVRIQGLDDIQTVGLQKILDVDQFNILNHALSRFGNMDELCYFADRFTLDMDTMAMIAEADDIYDEQFLMELTYHQHYSSWLQNKVSALGRELIDARDSAYKGYIRENIYPLIPGCSSLDQDLSVLCAAAVGSEAIKFAKTSADVENAYNILNAMFGIDMPGKTEVIDFDIEKFSAGIIPAIETFFGVKATDVDLGNRQNYWANRGTRWYAQGREMLATLMEGKSIHPSWALDKAGAILRVMGAFKQYHKWIAAIPVTMPEGLTETLESMRKELDSLQDDNNDLVVVQEDGFVITPIMLGDNFMIQV